jgi:hypothetical protein
LNSVDDDNRVVSLVGFHRHQLVPMVGDAAVAVDEDGAFYDASVEAVLSDSRIYLRLNWATKRVGTPRAIWHGQLQSPLVTPVASKTQSVAL